MRRTASADSNREVRPDLAHHFTDAGFPGAFVLLDVHDDHMLLVNATVCETRYLPASTFKIPNALIALESGVADGPDFPLPWDGVTREFEGWNRDHTLASAFSASALWYFQELARRVDPERYRDDLATFHVDGTLGSAVAGLTDCWLQPRAATPKPVWNPDVPQSIDFYATWQKMPANRTYENAFKAEWALFLRHVVEGGPFKWNLLEGAKGVQLAELGLRSWAERRVLDVPALT